jgi:spore germination protein KA
MLKRLAEVISFIKKENLTNKPEMTTDTRKPQVEPIPTNINDLRLKVRREFDRCEDIVIRTMEIGQGSFIKILVVYFDGLIDKETLNAHVLRPLLIDARIVPLDKSVNKRTIVNIIERNLLDNCEIIELTDFTQCINNILDGNTVLFIEGSDIALSTCTKGFTGRAVDEPDTESAIRGSGRLCRKFQDKFCPPKKEN